MELQNFIKILSELDAAITALNETAVKKQAAIIHNKHEEIGKILSEEQKLLQKIENLEAKRIETMKNIKTEYSISDNIINLKRLIQELSKHFTTEVIQKLSVLRNSIKEQSEKLRITNNQNKALIDNSRLFIKTLVTNLRGTANNFVINTKV